MATTTTTTTTTSAPTTTTPAPTTTTPAPTLIPSTTSRNFNALTFGLYLANGGSIIYPIKAVITEKFAGSLVNVDDKIFIHRLDVFALSITVYDSNMITVDVTSCTFKFTVRERHYDRPGKIIFVKESGSGIEFINAVAGVIGVTFAANDTKSTRPNLQYMYELEMFSGTDRITIMTGELIVRPV